MGRRGSHQSALGIRHSSKSHIKGHCRWLLLVIHAFVLHARIDVAQARFWKDVLSEEDIDQSLRGSSNGKHDNEHRPGEHIFETEEDPFDLPSSSRDIISYYDEETKGESDESTMNAPASAPTTQNIHETPTSRVSSYFDTTTAEPIPDNLFLRKPLSSSVSRTRDITSYRTTRTYVPPAESPKSSTSSSEAYIPDPISPSENTQTESPTEEDERYAYPENSVMPLQNLPWGYFNYDMSKESWHGPGYPIFNNELSIEYVNNAWIDYQPPLPIPPSQAMAIANGKTSNDGHNDYFYWDEFGPDGLGFGPWKNTLNNVREMPNQCGEIGKQSPIDIRPNGFACLEHHEIRTRRGDFRVFGKRDNFDLQILPSKLRVGVRRRPCRQIENPVCSEPDPPHADFPHGWPGFVDVLHVDFKFPSEHTIHGKSFDGEMQIYHLHPGRKRLPVVTVLMEVIQDENDRDAGYNEYLQEAIDGFQYEYDANRANCANNAIHNRNRRLRKAHRTSEENAQSERRVLDDKGNDRTIEELANTIFGRNQDNLEEYARLLDQNSTFSFERDSHQRRLAGIWNPHHESLVPSIYFYGYDGSLTEPPCSEIVSWFVIDETMKISRNQLEQMKFLLFTNVDGSTCESTSAHYQSSVARPIQETGSDRQIWHCTSEDYLPD